LSFATRVVTHADADPDAVAFRYRRLHGEVELLARGDLVSRASAAAVRLAARGVDRGDVVALVVSEHACQPILFFACLLAGAVPTFLAPPTPKLDPARYAAMIAALVSSSGCRLIVVSPVWAARLRAHVPSPMAICDEVAAPSARRLHRDPQPGAPLFLQHSSGTTGLQHGVGVTDRALVAQLERLAAVLRVEGDDVVASWLPLYHDMGLVACFLLPLYSGLAVTQLAPFDWLRRPALLFEAVTTDRGTLTYLPNFAFHHLAVQPLPSRVRLDSLRAAVNCSEPIDDSAFDLLLRACHSIGLREGAMASSYAMAENVFAVTHSVPGTPPRSVVHGGRRWVSSGRVLDGTSLRVVDERGKTLPDGEIGELAIRGDCLVAASDEHRTGDLGFVTGSDVMVTGRTSDLIIVGGRNVYPQDVEEVAAVEGVHPGRVVAVGVHSRRRGTDRVVVMAEARDGATLTDQALAARIRAALAASVDVPIADVVVVQRGWLVKSTSGKLSRRLCRSKAVAEKLIDEA
jgi:acyl-CoA synthetase (AMP-forming)/AMP-acid ligase II